MIRLLLTGLMVSLFVASGCSFLSPEPEEPTPLSERRSASATHVSPEAGDLFSKAHILWKGGDVCTDPAMAVHLLDQVLEMQPDYADAYMYRGLAYSEMGRDEETLADMTQAIRLDPQSNRYAYRGLAMIRLGNYAGAHRDLDQSLEMDSAQYRAWNFRGALGVLEENPEAACEDFSQACKNGDCSGLQAARKEQLCR